MPTTKRLAYPAIAIVRDWSSAAVVGIAAALLIVMTWLVAAAYLRQAETDALAVAGSERRNVAFALASQVDATVAQADAALLFMRRLWVEGGPEAFQREDNARRRSAVRNAVFEQLVVFNPDGRIVYTTLRGFLDETVSAADFEHFSVHAKAPETDALFIGRPVFGRVAKRWHVQITRAIHDKTGRFAGVIAASVRPERFAALHREISIGQGGVIAVVRDTGEYVARTERHDETLGRLVDFNPGLYANAPPTGGFRLTSTADHVERAYTWHKVTGTPLILYVGQSLIEIMKPVEELRHRVYGWLGGFTVLSAGLLGTLVRVARQKTKILEDLSESEKRFRGMFEKTNTGIFFSSIDRKLLGFNEAFQQLLGYDREYLLNRDFADFTEPDDLVVETPLFADLLAGGRREYRMEKRYRGKDDKIIWVDLCATAIRDDDGVVRTLVGTAYDITERKLNEIALANSNAELEQFGYAASHDLRQPLRMISSYLKLLERGAGPVLSDEHKEFLGYACDGALRMDQMLVSLLEYSRVGRRGEPMARHDSRDLLDEAMRFIAPDLEISGGRVSVEGDWPQITASRNEMVRLFQNLLSNALKYRRPDTAPQVMVMVARCDDGWLFTVSDDGIGIDPEQSGRLFKVFQRLTTRDAYDGAGVGLAVCRKIVERHGGRIWVESAGLGRGSAFRFMLPG